MTCLILKGMMSKENKLLPAKNDRIIINGWEDILVKVDYVEWVPNEARYKINLDWGTFGFSHVYDHDEGDIWRRFLEVN